MALPGQTFTILDGGIGVASPAADKVLVVGWSSAGTANTISTFASSSAVTSSIGYGPAADMAAHILQIAGGTVDVLSTAATVASSNSSVVHTGTGTPLVSVSGTPTNEFSVIVTIVAGGALGAGTFSYSLESYSDGSTATTSPTLTIPAGGTYAIPNTGLTLTFAPGTYVALDTYTFTSTPPIYNSTDLTAAINVLLATTTRYKFIVFAGQQATSAAGATIAGAITGYLTSLANQFRFTRAIVATGKDTSSTILSSYASFADARQMLVTSTAHVALPNTIVGRANPVVPFTVPLAARAAKIKISTNPAWVGYPGGGFPGVSFPAFDERVTGETFNNNKIVAPTTIIGQTGIFANNGLLKSATGSDFKYWQWGLVIDRACTVIYDGQEQYVNSFFRAKTDGTGSIDPRDAARVNKEVRARLQSALIDDPNDQGTTGHCSEFSYAVVETNNILSTGQLQSSARVIPFANAEQIATSIGFATAIQVAS